MKVINDRQFSYLGLKHIRYCGASFWKSEEENNYIPKDYSEYKDLFTVDLREEKAAKIINDWFEYYSTFFHEKWDDSFLGTLSAGFDTRIIFGFLKTLNRHLNILNYDREKSINTRFINLNTDFTAGEYHQDLDLVLPKVLCSYFNLDVTFFNKQKDTKKFENKVSGHFSEATRERVSINSKEYINYVRYTSQAKENILPFLDKELLKLKIPDTYLTRNCTCILQVIILNKFFKELLQFPIGYHKIEKKDYELYEKLIKENTLLK